MPASSVVHLHNRRVHRQTNAGESAECRTEIAWHAMQIKAMYSWAYSIKGSCVAGETAAERHAPDAKAVIRQQRVGKGLVATCICYGRLHAVAELMAHSA